MAAAVANGTVYIGSWDGNLYAIDADSGKLRWEFQTAASQQNSSKILNADGSLNQEAFAPVFGDFQDMYVDFYRYTLIGAIMAPPVVDNGVVYIGSMDGNFYALQ